jgi:TRAP-type C4-dicarboxylate transport system permease small subunit
MKNLKEYYVVFADSVNSVVRYACIVFFSIMVIDVVASVIMRYVLVKPMVWGEQLAVYCMIWIAFFSSSIAFRRGAHMGLDLLVKALNPKLSSIIQLIAHVIVLGFLLVLTVWGFKHTLAVSQQISPVVFNMSMSWFYSALPVGGICMMIQEVEVIIKGTEEDV